MASTSRALIITRENNSALARNYTIHDSANSSVTLYYISRGLAPIKSQLRIHSGGNSTAPTLANIKYPRQKGDDIVCSLSSGERLEVHVKGLTKTRWNVVIDGVIYVWQESFWDGNLKLHVGGKDGDVVAELVNKKYSFHWRQIGRIEMRRHGEVQPFVDKVVVSAIGLQELGVRETDKAVLDSVEGGGG